MLTSCVYCMRYELLLIARVKSYLLHTSYEFLFIAWVASYLLHTSYELQAIAWVTSYLSDTSYKLLFYCMSYELLFAYELWVTNYCMSYEFHFAHELVLIHELRVNVYCVDYFFKGFFVTLILTYLYHEKIRRSEEENTNMKKILSWIPFVQIYTFSQKYLESIFFFFETRNL